MNNSSGSGTAPTPVSNTTTADTSRSATTDTVAMDQDELDQSKSSSNRGGSGSGAQPKSVNFSDSVGVQMVETKQEEERHEKMHAARQVLNTKLAGVRHAKTSSAHTDREMVEQAGIQGIIFPWHKSYRIWWSITIAATILTAFFCPYTIAFEARLGAWSTGTAVIEFILSGIFVLDILINFNRAFHRNQVLVYERKQIAKSYCSKLFWVDVVGVFPFGAVALAIANEMGEDTNRALLLSMFRLLQLVRLYRLHKFFNHLQYNAHVSLMYFTLLRNGLAVLFVTNFAACTFYWLARLQSFDDSTWLGPLVYELNGVERYIISLYWSIVTFSTVGYGDFSPSNAIEEVFGMLYMLINMVVMAWTIGSITLLIVKGDEATSEYRDALQVLDQYADMHDFDRAFRKKLQTQLRLEFNNREISDEMVLKNFPNSTRRKILRKLYLQPLLQTNLMDGIRPQFVDAFLTACTVEIFTPGEHIVERGAISADLCLLVGGIAQATSEQKVRRKYRAGDFVGEIGFFTESPAVDSVTCLSVCKTLTMSQSAYKIIALDHPGSAGKILRNLLHKVEEMQLKLEIPTQIPVLRAGSIFDGADSDFSNNGRSRGVSDADAFDDTYNEMNDDSTSARRAAALEVERQKELTAIEDLVRMHMSKQKDDQTTRFLFAASRSDTLTISLMCDQGFDPDNADYDTRTALMVAAVKGNDDVVKSLLDDYNADPNIVDVHGTTALFEAVKNGHESTMAILLKHNATLCTKESYAATALCQAVFDGDIPFLRRLLKAGIQVDAADYDKRTAAHIAAAEGNVAAFKVLVEFGADLSVEDRWKNTVHGEAKRSGGRQLLEYLAKQQADKS